jgi:Holliday junction DNA helicase RuvA
MIGYLSGKLFEVDGNDVIIDVGGVGYRVRIIDNQATRNKLQATSLVQMYIHTYVKEDQLALYGFESKKALKFFQLLISVSGVGPKSAMGILAHGTPDQIQQAVAQADVSFFTKVSGIGKKNGQRIIVDLKSKLGSVAELDLSEPEAGTDDVFDALVGMGFDPKRVQKALQEIDPSLSEPERIKKAIKQLSQSS